MWQLLFLVPILEGCRGAQVKEDVKLNKINDLDGNFVRRWNKAASDGVIAPDEFREAGQLAQQTLGKGDDAFLDNLKLLVVKFTKRPTAAIQTSNIATFQRAWAMVR